MSADSLSVPAFAMLSGWRLSAVMVGSIALCAGSLWPISGWAAPSGLPSSGQPAPVARPPTAGPQANSSAITVYRTTLQDGSVEFSDRPSAADATSIGQSTYLVPDAADALKRAQVERDYWRKQAEDFDRRNRQRDAQLIAAAAAARRAQPVNPPFGGAYDLDLLPRPVYYVHGRPLAPIVQPQFMPGFSYAPADRVTVGSAVPFGLPYRPLGISR
jgi:hypothetical protein